MTFRLLWALLFTAMGICTVVDQFGLAAILSPGLAHAQEAASPAPPVPPTPKKEEEQPDQAFMEVRRLKEQIILLQNKGKLGFFKVVPCSSVKGFGVYAPIEPGGKASDLHLYFEPANVSTLVSEGRYVIDCSVDVFVYDDKGQVIGGKAGVLSIRRVTRSPVLDLFFDVRIPLKRPKKDHIVVKTVLHDNIKNASAVKSFKIQSGAKKPLPREV